MDHFKLSLVLTTSLLCCGSAFAQTPAESSQPEAAEMADIVVTAQKRSEKLTDVPLSITAASGAQLARQSITSAVDLPKITPGLTFVTSGYGSAVYSIRGMGYYDNALAITPAVTIYLDQVPLPFAAMTSGVALDPERVEVLKGPQGTLFGNNSTGGAINFIAAKPTDEFKAGADLTLGRFSQVEAGGFISGPITENLKARFAFRSEQSGDFIRAERLTNLTNSTTGDGVRDYTTGRTLNDRSGSRNFINGRVILDYTPSDRLKFELTASAWRDRSDTHPAQFVAFSPAQPNGGLPGAFIQANRPAAPNNNRVADWDQIFDLAQDTKFWQLALRGDLELNDQMALTSITSYARYDTYLPTDNDGSDWDDINNRTYGKIKSFSQELRLAGDLGDRVKFMLGANYASDISKDDQHVRMDSTNAFLPDVLLSGSPAADQLALQYFGQAPVFAGHTTLPGQQNAKSPGVHRWINFYNINYQHTKTYSGFGSLDFKLTDQLTLQASARYSKQDRDHQGCGADGGDGELADTMGILATAVYGVVTKAPPGGCIAVLGDGTVGMVRDTLNEDNLSWRGSINYKPTPDSLIYANITRGYKAGSFGTLPIIFAFGGQGAGVPQEEVTAYEVGFKASLLDRKVQLTGAAFYYDYKNKQLLGFLDLPVFGLVPGLASVDGKVTGAEAEVIVYPVSGLRLNAAATYVKTEGKGDELVFDGFARTSRVDGQPFPRTPKWQVIAGAEYSFDVGSDLRGFVGGNVNYQGGSYAAFGDASLPGNNLFKMEGYALIDLRAGIENDRWRAMLWGKNVTNKFYVTDVTHTIDNVSRSAGLPATYGVTVGVKF